MTYWIAGLIALIWTAGIAAAASPIAGHESIGSRLRTGFGRSRFKLKHLLLLVALLFATTALLPIWSWNSKLGISPLIVIGTLALLTGAALWKDRR